MPVTVMELAEIDTKLRRVARNEYAGPCPECGGDDRFHVNLTKREGGAWMCRNCWEPRTNGKGWGDAIEYLRQFRGMSFQQAKDYVQRNETTTASYTQALSVKQGDNYGSAPPQDWQARTSKYVQEAIARLWSEEGIQARDYLHTRGLHDETIRNAHLGYAAHMHPKTKQTVPCILFPWYSDRETTLWCVQLRDIREGIPSNERYFMLPGSSRGGLYLADSLKLKRPAVFLVEGEIDALTIAQEAGKLVAVVATGSTTGARTARWRMRLARVPRLLVAYDKDESGDTNSGFWLGVNKNAQRYRPLEHDANMMLACGYDIRAWVEAALPPVQEMASQEEEQKRDSNQEEWEPSDTEEGEELYCARCGGIAERVIPFGECGVPSCTDCQPFFESPQTEREKFERSVYAIASMLGDGGITIRHKNDPPFEKPTASQEQEHEDVWEKIHRQVMKPPKDVRTGKPFYTPAEWARKWQEMINQPPDPKLTAHILHKQIA